MSFQLLNLRTYNEDFRVVVIFNFIVCRIPSLNLPFSICLCNVPLSTFDETKLFQCTYGLVYAVRLQDYLHGYRRGGMHFDFRHSVPVFRLLVQFAVSQHCFVIQTFSYQILLLLVNSFLKAIQ